MKKKLLLVYLDCHKSAEWIETKDFVFELSAGNGMSPMETLVGEGIPVVDVKNEFIIRDT